ncbi:PTS system mannose/fructose/sorbose family transporter subunit IID [Leptotrichia trevisanii]
MKILGFYSLLKKFVINSLLPGLLALLLTFACMHLLKRKINAIWIIFGFFVIGIVGYWLGILA